MNKQPTAVRVTLIETDRERYEGGQRVLWDGAIPLNAMTGVVLPAHETRRPSSIQATELQVQVRPIWSRCPDCVVDPGQLHADGCDVARCWVCRCRRLVCRGDHEPTLDVWTGTWPEV